MVRTKDVKKTQQWIRDKIRTTDEFQELLKKTLTDASAVEQWVENVLCEKDGPKKVLDVVYTEGPALDFLKFMTRIAGKSSKEQQEAFINEKIPHLQALHDVNQGERYYRGKLWNERGETSKSVLRQLRLTGAGKMQLLLNGNGAVEIALRDVVGKQFFQRVVEMFQREKQVREEYSQVLANERLEVTNLFHAMVHYQTEDLHVPKAKATSTVRACTRTLYKPMIPDFKSATDAVLCANNKLSMEDAKKAKDGKENEMSIPQDELKKKRKSYSCVADQMTRWGHTSLSLMRMQAQVLMHEDGLSPKQAHEEVANDALRNGTFIHWHIDSKTGLKKPRPPEFQAKINFDKEYDLDLFRAESMGADPRALPAPGGGGGGGGGGGLDDDDEGGGEGSGLSSLTRKRSQRHLTSSSTSLDLSSSTSFSGSPSIPQTKKKPKKSQVMSHSFNPLSAGISRAGGKAPVSVHAAALKAGAAAKAKEQPTVEEEEDEEEMSAYEKERLAKIKRNNAFLLNLGIDTLQAPVTPPRHGAARTAPGKGKEEEEWTPVLMINKKDWPGIVPNFKHVANYLGSEAGTVWRQGCNITTVATAEELLAWYTHDNKLTQKGLNVNCILKDGSQVRVEPEFRKGSLAACD